MTSPKPIKNARSEIDMGRLCTQLEQTLASHGAQQIRMDYDEQGLRRAVFFSLDYHGRPISVKLPARVEQAQAVLKRQYDANLGSLRKMGTKAYSYEHAYRVAWRNIVDWVEAQMALLELELAKMEEVFFPYITSRSGQTMFEQAEAQQLLLGDGSKGAA